MISKIVLRNFLSHSETDVDLSGSTVSVTGDNGCGKSALLEAIPYAYYGIGRETKEGMSRIHGDGSHLVEIHSDDGTVVSRGRKVSGAGFCEVRVGGDLVSRGKEADDWIANHLGMDSNTFMLTAFFGLGDNHVDTLLSVTPSGRLETLQHLAQVGPYRALHAKAKAHLTESDRRFESAKSRKEGAESAIEGSESLDSELKRYQAEVDFQSETFKGLRNKRGELQGREEVYRAFVGERERLSAERSMLTRTIDNLVRRKASCEETIEEAKTTISESKKRLRGLSSEELPDLESIDSEMSDIRSTLAVKETLIRLREVASQLSVEDASCPLCHQPITPEIVKSWELEIDELRSDMDDIQGKSTELTKIHSHVSSTLDSLSRCNRIITDQSSDMERAVSELTSVVKELSGMEADLRKKDDRYIALTEKLGSEYQDLQKEIEAVARDMDECQKSKHAAEGSIVQLKQSISRAEYARKVISEAVSDMKSAKADGRVAAILRDAWSRYGIPLRMVTRLNSRIEERATAVYQEFDNGRIEVREVEDRGRPGVQFYLVDRKGDRTYNQLSKGEKMMFFVAIRLAVAYVVVEDSPVSVDFLILDEALGNLSPKRREDMIRLINKSLRKLFPQVVLVTHTTVPEIFDRSIDVTMQNDTSIVRVL